MRDKTWHLAVFVVSVAALIGAMLGLAATANAGTCPPGWGETADGGCTHTAGVHYDGDRVDTWDAWDVHLMGDRAAVQRITAWAEYEPPPTTPVPQDDHPAGLEPWQQIDWAQDFYELCLSHSWRPTFSFSSAGSCGF